MKMGFFDTLLGAFQANTQQPPQQLTGLLGPWPSQGVPGFKNPFVPDEAAQKKQMQQAQQENGQDADEFFAMQDARWRAARQAAIDAARQQLDAQKASANRPMSSLFNSQPTQYPTGIAPGQLPPY